MRSRKRTSSVRASRAIKEKIQGGHATQCTRTSSVRAASTHTYQQRAGRPVQTYQQRALFTNKIAANFAFACAAHTGHPCIAHRSCAKAGNPQRPLYVSTVVTFHCAYISTPTAVWLRLPMYLPILRPFMIIDPQNHFTHPRLQNYGKPPKPKLIAPLPRRHRLNPCT